MTTETGLKPIPGEWNQSGSFHRWWVEIGQFMDPDTEDVSWFDKRKSLSQAAYYAGITVGLAVAGNYTADDPVEPTVLTFANGNRVKNVNGKIVLERVKP